MPVYVLYRRRVLYRVRSQHTEFLNVVFWAVLPEKLH